MRIRLVGAQLFHADRHTDQQAGMAKLIFAFHFLRMPLDTTVINLNYTYDEME